MAMIVLSRIKDKEFKILWSNKVFKIGLRISQHLMRSVLSKQIKKMIMPTT